MKNQLTFSLVSLFVFADQITKYFVRFWNEFYICNKGVAFGINLPHWLILSFIIIFICFFSLSILKLKNPCFAIFQKTGRISSYPLTFILAGAISNFIDRLYFGCVIDFINLGTWPVFNLADIFICLGFFLLIISNLSSPKK